MSEPVHIVEQIREAFTLLLNSAVGEEHVHQTSRLANGFQSDQYPLVVLSVTDTVIERDQNNGIDTLNIDVDIKLSERTNAKRPESTLSAMRLKLQNALSNRGNLGFGKYWNWKVESLAGHNFEPMADHPNSFAFAAVLPVSFTIQVRTDDYSKNLIP